MSDNTFGFPAGTTFPTSANFGVSRLDVLQNELSSGYYTQTADIASLTREIGRVQNGSSGDMNVAGSSASADSASSFLPDWMVSINKSIAKTLSDSAANNPTSLANIAANGTGGIVSNSLGAVKAFFVDSSVTIVTIIVGVILLVGAFLIYRK